MRQWCFLLLALLKLWKCPTGKSFLQGCGGQESSMRSLYWLFISDAFLKHCNLAKLDFGGSFCPMWGFFFGYLKESSPKVLPFQCLPVYPRGLSCIRLKVLPHPLYKESSHAAFGKYYNLCSTLNVIHLKLICGYSMRLRSNSICLFY